MSDLEPLDEDVRALLRRAKPIEELSADRKADLYGQLASRMAMVPVLVDGADAGAGAGAGLGAGALVTSSVRVVAIALASLSIGIGAGIGIDRAVLAPRTPRTALAPPSSSIAQGEVGGEAARPPPPSAFTATARVASLPSVPFGSRPDSRADGPVGPVPPSSVSKDGPAHNADSSRGLAAERALLDVARAALARSDGAVASGAVERHAREFPDGILVEEREAIAVRALVAEGRRAEARARAVEFRRRFPNSVNLHAVNAAVGGEP